MTEFSLRSILCIHRQCLGEVRLSVDVFWNHTASTRDVVSLGSRPGAPRGGQPLCVLFSSVQQDKPAAIADFCRRVRPQPNYSKAELNDVKERTWYVVCDTKNCSFCKG